MTISTTDNRKEYTGNGVTVDFSFPYYFLADTDLVVYLNGVLQTLTTHYTVAGAGNPAGGTVTFLTAPTDTYPVVITRDPPLTQTKDWVENDPDPAEEKEEAFDKITMIVQRLHERIDRSIQLGDADTSGIDLTLPTPVADMLLAINETADAVTLASFVDSIFVRQEGTPATDGSKYLWLKGSTGVLYYFDETGSTWKALGTAAFLNTGTGDSDLPDTEDLKPYLGKNILINGDGVIAQDSAAGAVNDDTYWWDQWVILSDGNGVVTPTQETSDLPTGTRNAMKLTVAIANKKFGLLQIAESSRCKQLISNVASLSAKAKASGIANLRVAILSWDGTADSPTTDVVSAWNGAGTDPTLVANWTYENTPANISLSTSWASTYKALNVSIDTASVKQVAAFVWVDDVDAAVSDYLMVTDVQVEKGAIDTDYEMVEKSIVTNQCHWFFRRIKTEVNNLYVATGIATGANTAYVPYTLPNRMRKKPTMGTTGTAGDYSMSEGSATYACTSVPSIQANNSSEDQVMIAGVSTGNLTATEPFMLLCANANAYLDFDARF